MTNLPSTHGPNGQDHRGRFAPGNKLGRGNPLAGRVARIRAVLLRELTPAAVREIGKMLIGQAKAGDLAAVKELLDRTIGRPGSTELLQRVEALELTVAQRDQRDNGEKPE
jgi:hypothetical protein